MFHKKRIVGERNDDGEFQYENELDEEEQVHIQIAQQQIVGDFENQGVGQIEQLHEAPVHIAEVAVEAQVEAEVAAEGEGHEIDETPHHLLLNNHNEHNRVHHGNGMDDMDSNLEMEMVDGKKQRKRKTGEEDIDDDEDGKATKKRAKKGATGPKKQYREGETNSKNFETIIIALTLYKQKYNNLKIPYKFIIPSAGQEGCDDWPEDLWGLKLGARLKSIRRENNFANHREELDELGVEFDALKDYKGFDKLRDALKVYKAIHGDLVIPYCYEVPKGDPLWQEDMYGMKLGMRIYDIRYRGTFKEHKQELIGS